VLGIVREMKKKKSGISEETIGIFEGILNQYRSEEGLIRGQDLLGVKCFGPEWDDEFCQAISNNLTKEQRFHLYETQGGCNGTGSDKERKAFALENAHLALDERMALFAEKFKRCKPTLNDDNTITLRFKCSHGYYKLIFKLEKPFNKRKNKHPLTCGAFVLFIHNSNHIFFS